MGAGCIANSLFKVLDDCWVYNCSSRRAQWAPELRPRAAQPTQSTVQPAQCSEVIDVSDISASVLVKETPRFNVPDGYLNTSPE